MSKDKILRRLKKKNGELNRIGSRRQDGRRSCQASLGLKRRNPDGTSSLGHFSSELAKETSDGGTVLMTAESQGPCPRTHHWESIWPWRNVFSWSHQHGWPLSASHQLRLLQATTFQFLMIRDWRGLCQTKPSVTAPENTTPDRGDLRGQMSFLWESPGQALGGEAHTTAVWTAVLPWPPGGAGAGRMDTSSTPGRPWPGLQDSGVEF